MENAKVIMEVVVNDFNTMLNEGYDARHRVLLHESSIETAQLYKALGIASADDYRARYIVLMACIVEHIDKSEALCNELVSDVQELLRP